MDVVRIREPQVHDVEAVLALVVVAIATAALAPRLRIPPPSILVVVGLGIGFVPGLPAVRPTPDLVTLGVLPPLLFAAAQQISLIDLRQVWRSVTVLALGLVLVTAAAVAGVALAVVPAMGLSVAFTFGAVLASTDPVAVTALSRTLRLPARLATVVQAESLFNDATSLVLFEVAVAAAVGHHVGVGDAVGVVVGVLAATCLRRTTDPTVQAATSVVAPYAAAVAAQAASVSPVTAVIVAGLLLGRRRARTRHAEGRLVSGTVYEVIVFVLENAIFAIIGLELATFLRALDGADAARTVALVVCVAVTLLAVRAAALVGPLGLRRASGHSRDEQPAWQLAAVMTWAGARGVIPLAAALAIPTTTHAGHPFPHRAMLLVSATAVVVLTLVVQGTTLAPLVRRLGVATPPDVAVAEVQQAERSLAIAAMDHLDHVAESVSAGDDVTQRLRDELQRKVAHREDREVDSRPSDPAASTRLRRELLDVQAEELGRLRLAGQISAETFRQLQRQLDIEHARLAD